MCGVYGSAKKNVDGRQCFNIGVCEQGESCQNARASEFEGG